MWTQIDETSLSMWKSIVDVEPAYDGTTLEGLQNLLTNRHQLWVWDDGTNRIALTIGIGGDEVGRIKTAFCDGPQTGRWFCETWITKVREIADAYNVIWCRAKANQTYQTAAMQRMLDEVPNVIWELTDIPKLDQGQRFYHLYRCPVCRGDQTTLDADMLGVAIIGHNHDHEAA